MCVCVLPECNNIVAGGPAHHKAPLWTRAALTHLVHVGCSPHLAHTRLGLLLKVVGWSGSAETEARVRPCIHPQNKNHHASLQVNRCHGDAPSTYLALLITSMSVKRKRCLSWVCTPLRSWTCPWRRRDLSKPARKEWTNEQLSGDTGSWKLSLDETHTQKKEKKCCPSRANSFFVQRLSQGGVRKRHSGRVYHVAESAPLIGLFSSDLIRIYLHNILRTDDSCTSHSDWYFWAPNKLIEIKRFRRASSCKLCCAGWC